MKHCLSLLALVSVLGWSATVLAGPVDVSEELSLAVGENRTLPAADVKNYSEGVQGIVEVKVTPNGGQFVIVGQKPGTTTLLLLKKDGQELLWKINVFPQPVKMVESELSQLLGDTPGVRVRRVGSRFFVEGGVTTEPELQRIEHVAQLYKGQVESLVVLGGVAADRKINLRVELFFVQYEKTYNLQFGMNWPAIIGGGTAGTANFAYDFLARTTVGAVASLTDQPLPGLDLAARNGWAKVLKHATLITANGVEAEYSNGGAQWFAAAAGLTSTLREINFGTTLKILPRFDPKTGEMLVKVGADTADLTPPLTSATNLPGQNTSKLATSVALKLGQSLILSGIRTSTARHTTAGIPWLSQIPLIGLLFGTQGVQDQELEGAVFIVPSVIENVPRHSAELVEQNLREFREYDGDDDDFQPLEAAPNQKKATRP
jgi:pilus assembly protein CpaC